MICFTRILHVIGVVLVSFDKILPPAVQFFLKIFSKLLDIVDGGFIGFIWYLTFLRPVMEVLFKNEDGCFHLLETAASSIWKNFHLLAADYS